MPKTNHKVINVLLSSDEAELFEAYCERGGYKKSPLIARLIRDHLEAEEFGEVEMRRVREKSARYGKPIREEP